MISNNKILTVSYGTFSCTLEGFDDSFGTMKAIAEYFRDLASDDRYFGAEPPIPDAEMLARIAEREISRRVDAREHEGKIVLSASDPSLDTPAPAQETATPKVAVQDDAARIAEAEQAKQSAAEAEAEAEAARVQARAEEEAARAAAKAKAAALAAEEALAAQQAQKEKDTAAKAQADAAALALVAAQLAEQDIADVAQSVAAVEPRDLAAELPEADAFFAETKIEDTTGEALDDMAFEDISYDVENAMEDITAEKPELDAEAAPAAVAHQPDSIAAKLERIRAVVSQAETSADDEDDGYIEDEHADDTASSVSEDLEVEAAPAMAKDPVVDAALADIEAALAADATADAQDAQDAANEDEDDISAILAGLEADKEEELDATEVAENLFDDSMDAGEPDFDIASVMDAEEAPAPATDEVADPRRVARVIKVKRADLEAAIAHGDLEEVEEDLGPTSLSQEDEDELLRDLAQVESEIDAPDLHDDVAMDAELEADLAAALADDAPAAKSVPDADVGRLMAQTDEQMDDAEGSQNREAFAHLRAAVAAKKADSGLKTGADEQEEVPYRSDLAEVVKPRRPSVQGSERSQRPDTAERPAPLKLVAEQRVDAVQADTRGPVRPRRVAAVAQPVSADADSFADYASELGAVKLPDLLEAAASYMSFVEGRDQFSRPQLMNKVRQVEQDEFSREDGLRSFGQLLRAGKIEKIKGGRFTVTGDIGYRPDTRAAG